MCTTVERPANLSKQFRSEKSMFLCMVYTYTGGAGIADAAIQ